MYTRLSDIHDMRTQWVVWGMERNEGSMDLFDWTTKRHLLRSQVPVEATFVITINSALASDRQTVHLATLLPGFALDVLYSVALSLHRWSSISTRTEYCLCKIL